ncbi:dTDP-4-dehydrorhamnose reductase [Hydrogenophilus islandicus]
MSRPKLLLLGRTGQVGWTLAPRLALDYDLIAPDRQTLDLTDLAAVEHFLAATRPAAIVNAAAYTAVDRAESEPAIAYRLNRDLPALLAAWCQANGAALLHYSTDYVFDGTLDRPYREDDPPAPCNTYGASKLAGEEMIRASGARAVILRVSWVFGPHGNNFLKTMLRLARSRKELAVVTDQIGAPTGVELIAAVSERLLARLLTPEIALPPLLHLTPQGEVSWYHYAQYLLTCAARYGWPLAVAPEAIRSITTADYPTAAARPHNSRLDTTRLRQLLGITLPPWQEEVARTVEVLVHCCATG